MSSLTWLDFSDAERKRALQVVELLGRKETRDELGLGTIRDAFADAMFPGMSTVQRRAAYFLLVPWTFRAIERHPRKGWAPLARARRRELQMIDALLAGGDRDGVIGGRAGQRLRQVPSMIYWAGLGRWGIRRVSGTREQWSRAVAKGMPLAVDDDGQVVTGDGGVSWWHAGLPEPPDTFPDVVSLRLRTEDADYLRTRIMARCPGTVLAALAEREEPWTETTYPWELPMPELDPANAELVRHAQRFAEVMNGAALLYNHELARHFDDEAHKVEYREALDIWAARESASAPLELDAMWALLDRLGSRHTARTRKFVEDWNALSRDPETVLVDRRFLDRVRDREREVKTRQARLSFPAARETWRGAAGAAQLEYRWNSTQRQVLDIVTAGGS